MGARYASFFWNQAMSETILKILLSELQTLRIVCKSCGAVVEMRVGSFDRKGKQGEMRCPGCNIEIRVGRADQNHAPPADALDSLADAWKKLAAMPNVDIQFVVPIK